MGIDINAARCLLYCKRFGVDLSRTAMIGRQGLHLSARELMNVFDSFGQQVDAQNIESIMTQNDGYAEPFLAHLGAREVHSFDVSEYEHATYIHDMNQPLPDRFKGQYTTVIDGGSLEHVFNFPVAIKNCMEMVSVGGHFIAFAPTNNFCGHGFYQFSPELYFSIFTPENGFDVVKAIAFEDKPNARWFSVLSPVEARSRVELVNGVPTYFVVIAKKVAEVPIFRTTPQQSDYLATWDRHGAPLEGAHTPYVKDSKRMIVVKSMLSPSMKAFARRMRKRFLGDSTSVFLRPFDPAKDHARR